VKGDGEILEEIVTKERHKEVNKVGTITFTSETFFETSYAST